MTTYLISESDRQEILAALEATGRDNRLAYGVRSLKQFTEQPVTDAEVESLRKDAEKYRFIRSHCTGLTHYAGEGGELQWSDSEKGKGLAFEMRCDAIDSVIGKAAERASRGQA